MPTITQIQFVTCFRFLTGTNSLNFSSNQLYNSPLLLIAGLLWSSSNQIMPHLVSSSLYSFCKVISPNRLTALHILIYLRQRLLAAIEQDNKDDFQDLAKIFNLLWDVVDKNNIPGVIGRVIEDLERSAYDYSSGVGFKAIIPSEEDIKAALGEENLTS